MGFRQVCPGQKDEQAASGPPVSAFLRETHSPNPSIPVPPFIGSTNHSSCSGPVFAFPSVCLSQGREKDLRIDSGSRLHRPASW